MDISSYSRTWAEIDLSAAARNIALARAALRPGCMIMAVVKADAYGHGYRYIAREFQNSGADWLGVSNLGEAVSLRNAGIELPILIFGPTAPEMARALARHSLTQTVYSTDYARSLHSEAAAAGIKLNVHIKLDTGMTRLGIGTSKPEEAVGAVKQICSLRNFNPEAIYTHFSCSDDSSGASKNVTDAQFSLFEDICGKLKSENISFPIRHCCNSGGVLNFPHMQLDLVRPGIMLYGLHPAGAVRHGLSLTPVMSIKSMVSRVSDVGPGTAVSYGRTYAATSPSRIATVQIGYADGYRRSLSNCGRMILNESYANIVGRVCMDQLMLDVTGIEGVRENSVVTVMGRDGSLEITADEIAGLIGTINYEVLCLIGKRVPRIYIKDGVRIAESGLPPDTNI